MAATRPMTWAPAIGAIAMAGLLAAGIGWRLHLTMLEQRVKDRRAGLKKLNIS